MSPLQAADRLLAVTLDKKKLQPMFKADVAAHESRLTVVLLTASVWELLLWSSQLVLVPGGLVGILLFNCRALIDAA